jgi:predicted nucleotidyltransferase
MIYGLTEEVVEAICKIFQAHPEVEKVILYGSRAKGNFKPASDIDLTFFGPLIDQTVLNKISWELDDLLLAYTFDLSIYSQINNPDLLDHIERVGTLFYSKSLLQ